MHRVRSVERPGSGLGARSFVYYPLRHPGCCQAIEYSENRFFIDGLLSLNLRRRELLSSMKGTDFDALREVIRFIRLHSPKYRHCSKRDLECRTMSYRHL
jgi:hypothetical protein